MVGETPDLGTTWDCWSRYASDPTRHRPGGTAPGRGLERASRLVTPSLRGSGDVQGERAHKRGRGQVPQRAPPPSVPE